MPPADRVAGFPRELVCFQSASFVVLYELQSLLADVCCCLFTHPIDLCLHFGVVIPGSMEPVLPVHSGAPLSIDDFLRDLLDGLLPVSLCYRYGVAFRASTEDISGEELHPFGIDHLAEQPGRHEFLCLVCCCKVSRVLPGSFFHALTDQTRAVAVRRFL